MDKVVHLFEIFKTIFYFKFLDLGKAKFGSIKVCKNLNVFKQFEIFKMVQIASPVTVAPGPRVSYPSPLLGAARARHPPTPVSHGPVPTADRHASPPPSVLLPHPSICPPRTPPPSAAPLKGAARRHWPPFLFPSHPPSQALHEQPLRPLTSCPRSSPERHRSHQKPQPPPPR
jgi:hypothetical protein